MVSVWQVRHLQRIKPETSTLPPHTCDRKLLHLPHYHGVRIAEFGDERLHSSVSSQGSAPQLWYLPLARLPQLWTSGYSRWVLKNEVGVRASRQFQPFEKKNNRCASRRLFRCFHCVWSLNASVMWAHGCTLQMSNYWSAEIMVKIVLCSKLQLNK